MSQEDYARLFIHAPSRLIFALVVAAGGGAGFSYFSAHDNGVGEIQERLDACVIKLADYRTIAQRYESELGALGKWAKETVRALPEVQRMEALNRAPEIYSYATGVEISR